MALIIRLLIHMHAWQTAHSHVVREHSRAASGRVDVISIVRETDMLRAVSAIGITQDQSGFSNVRKGIAAAAAARSRALCGAYFIW